MSEAPKHDCKRYALRGFVPTEDEGAILIEFDAYDDADAWKQADCVALPANFMAGQMIELTADGERNVPPSHEAFTAIFGALIAPSPIKGGVRPWGR